MSFLSWFWDKLSDAGSLPLPPMPFKNENMYCPHCRTQMRKMGQVEQGNNGTVRFIYEHRCCPECRTCWQIRADIPVKKVVKPA